MTKKSRITSTFQRLKRENKKAFIPYIMAGDPDLEKTFENVMLLEKCGADIIELGVPFTDPLADGPTIQMAAERALKAGVTLTEVIEFVRRIRNHSQIPIVLMTYYNPVFKYNDDFFIADAVNAGVDGVIIPDLPPDEADDFIKKSRISGLDTIFLIAPISTEERIKKITKACRGFVYYVSITGVTGARFSPDNTFKEHIKLVKRITDKPLAVGFGVSSPDDARAVAEIADGVIIGSAIVKRLYEHPSSSREFIKKLREAI